MLCLLDPILANPLHQITLAAIGGDEVTDIFGTGILEADDPVLDSA